MRYLLCLFSILPAAAVKASPNVAGYERFGSGAVLYSELGCTNCHGGGKVEVPRSGPVLSGLSVRINFDWLTEFLKTPQAVHPGTSMPRLTHSLSDSQITSLALFLGSAQPGKPLRPERHANPERGSVLYHEKGCVACHAAAEDHEWAGDGDASESFIAFPDLGEKYSLTSLDHFLANVSKYRPDGRMPHILLTKDESLDVAAHLLDFKGSDPRESVPLRPWPKATKPQLQEGKALFTRLDCVACHTVAGVNPLELSTLRNSSGACLAEAPMPGIPWYALTGAQREALAAFIESGESAEHDTLAALNCLACHARDGVGGPLAEANAFFIGDESLGDSGRLPPPLTGIGRKLRPDWLESVLQGNPEGRVRPYLKTQMPGYSVHAKRLAAWLRKTDAVAHVPTMPDLDDKHLVAGKKLLGVNGGVNCVTCHNWAGNRSPGIPGPDLKMMGRRLRPEWFRQYLLDPSSYRPGTLMPALWPGSRSTISDVLGGDAEKQISAIWHFIARGEGIPEGYASQSSGEFELVPKGRPIIQRTFLKQTGTKAILVGFPGQIHLSFDGGRGQPSLVWKGRFFDAYNTWFTRSAPFGIPLGEETYSFTKMDAGFRFRGYQLDENGNPEFLLEKDGQSIREHYQVVDGKLIRSIAWKSGSVPPVAKLDGVKTKVVDSKNKRIITYFTK